MYQAKSTVQMDTRNHGAGYQQQANSLSMNALNHLQGGTEIKPTGFFGFAWVSNW